MTLAIDVGGFGDVAVAVCHGHIVRGETASRFGSKVAALLASHSRVVLDLDGVTYVDAGGLGALASLLHQAGGCQGRLVVASASGRVAHLLRLTRLDSQFRTAVSLPSQRTGPQPPVAQSRTSDRDSVENDHSPPSPLRPQQGPRASRRSA